VRRTKRTNPGKVAVQAEAWKVVRESRGDLLKVWGAILAILLALNLVLAVPAYERGLITGILLTSTAAMTWWVVWYASGLGPRLEGTWAEGFTAEQLGKVTSELHVVPNLRFDGYDVDHVALARHGVYVIETKLRRTIYDDAMRRDLHSAAVRARTVRLELTKDLKVLTAPTEGFVCPVLVVWGRPGRDMVPSLRTTDAGDVVLVGGPHLMEWLSAQGRGTIPRDQVEQMCTALEQVALVREAKQAPESRVARWLARA
jgi:hypothetical protein